nr:MAG TPA: hypothetical protein [Caudoviricetes sp.]
MQFNQRIFLRRIIIRKDHCFVVVLFLRVFCWRKTAIKMSWWQGYGLYMNKR